MIPKIINKNYQKSTQNIFGNLAPINFEFFSTERTMRYLKAPKSPQKDSQKNQNSDLFLGCFGPQKIPKTKTFFGHFKYKSDKHSIITKQKALFAIHGDKMKENFHYFTDQTSAFMYDKYINRLIPELGART